MPDIKQIQGYTLKDEQARNDLANFKTEVAQNFTTIENSFNENIETTKTELHQTIIETKKSITALGEKQTSDIETVNQSITALGEQHTADIETVNQTITELKNNKVAGDLYVTPEMYGAVGDGVTNDTVAVQSALDSGYNVQLKKGSTYLCGYLYIPSNTKIIGYGSTLKAINDGLLLNKSDNENGIYEQTKNIVVSGVTFSGIGLNNCTTLGFSHAYNVTIKDCIFRDVNSWHMIEVNASKDVLIDNCLFYNYGINQGDIYATEMIQIDCAYEGGFPWFGPYDNTPCENVTIQNCSFYGNRINGVSGIGNHSYAEHNNINIKDCIFDNLLYGVKFTSLSGCVISGCSFSCTCCINLDGQIKNVTIKNNKMRFYLYSTLNYGSRAIYTVRNDEKICENIVVDGNDIAGFGNHGLTVQCDKYQIINNVVKDCMGVGIYVGYSDRHGLISNNNAFNNGIDTANLNRDIYLNIGVIIDSGGDIVITNNTVGKMFISTANISDNLEKSYCFNNVIKTAIERTTGTATICKNNLVAGEIVSDV